MENGYEIDRSMIIIPYEERKNGVYENMKQLLSQEKKPDAVFCFNDKVAVNVCRAVQDMGRKVSEEVGIIGYDNNIYALSIIHLLPRFPLKVWKLGKRQQKYW